MATAREVIELEQKLRRVLVERTAAEARADCFHEFIRETGKGDEFLRWKAKKLGIYETIYGDAR